MLEMQELDIKDVMEDSVCKPRNHCMEREEKMMRMKSKNFVVKSFHTIDILEKKKKVKEISKTVHSMMRYQYSFNN